MTQFDVMRELYNDRSSWVDMKHYPSTVVCRRILRLADFAAADPARFGSCRMAFEVPELSYRELAIARGVSHATIARHLAPEELGDARDFTVVELDGERPAWLRVFPVQFEAGNISQTYRNASMLCTFAASQPARWRVVRITYMCPELSQQEVAEICGVCVRSVRNYLQPIHLESEIEFKNTCFETIF